MAITRTGVLISTNTTFGDSDDRDFYISGGQLGTNQVPVSGLTPDTVYYAKGYIQQNGTTITDPSYTAFRTSPIGDAFYFKNESNGYNTMTLFTRGTPESTDLEYTLDGSTWTPFDLTQQYNYVSVPQGGSIYMRSSTGFSTDSSNYISIFGSATFSVGGNIAALIDYTDVDSITELTGGEFEYMFMGSNQLVSAANIDWCKITDVLDMGIREMFMNCSGLVEPPDMSNFENITGYCAAQGVFSRCTSLRSIPVFTNLTTLGRHSFEIIFSECTSFTSIPTGMFPNLTQVDEGALTSAFAGCTGLTSIASDLFSSGDDYDSLYETFKGCTGLTSIPSGLFSGTDLTKTSFYGTFAFCTELTYIPADLFPTSTTSPMCNGMFNGCTSLRSIPQGLLPATNLVNFCYNSMFRNCTGLIDIPVDLLPATTLAQHCYRGMFYGCTSITTAPTLPGRNTNVYNCYYEMFCGCTSLNKIIVYADVWDQNNTSSWVYNVSNNGDFYSLGTANISTGYDGIPTGWTVHTSI